MSREHQFSEKDGELRYKHSPDEPIQYTSKKAAKPIWGNCVRCDNPTIVRNPAREWEHPHCSLTRARVTKETLERRFYCGSDGQSDTRPRRCWCSCHAEPVRTCGACLEKPR